MLEMSSGLSKGPHGWLGYKGDEKFTQILIEIIRSHEIRISIFPTRIQWNVMSPGFDHCSNWKKFWIRFKALQKRKDEAPTYRMVNRILII